MDSNAEGWVKGLVEYVAWPKGAWPEVIEWARGHESFNTAWKDCDWGNWMLWLAVRCSGTAGSMSRKKAAYVAAQCAQLALPEDALPTTIDCLSMCYRYYFGHATLCEVKAAADLADFRYAASPRRIAARSAARAARIAYLSIEDAAIMADAAVSYAARAVSWGAVCSKECGVGCVSEPSRVEQCSCVYDNMLKQCAHTIRRYYPTSSSLRRIFVGPEWEEGFSQ